MSKKVIKRKKTRKELRREITDTQDQFTESGTKLWDWVEEHWKPIMAVIGAVMLLAVVVQLFSAGGNQKEEAAAAALFEAEKDLPGQFVPAADFTADEIDEAIAGLDTVIAEHAGTASARIAGLQAGNLLLEVGRYDDALARLNAVKTGRDLVGIQAHVSAATALEGKGEQQAALDRLLQAVGFAGGEYRDLLNMDVARLYEALGKPDAAIKIYEDYVNRNEESAALYSKAQQRLERLGAKSSDGEAAGN